METLSQVILAVSTQIHIIQFQFQFSLSVMSVSLPPHEPQHARPPCPSPTLGVHPNPCPLSRWCHSDISSSVIPFSSCPQSFPASGSFQMNQLFASGGQIIGVSASPSALPMNIQDWFPLGWTPYHTSHYIDNSKLQYGLPWWFSGKTSTCQCGRFGFNSWEGKILWRRKQQSIPVLLPRRSIDRGTWWAMESHGVRHNLVTKWQQQQTTKHKYSKWARKLIAMQS